MTGFLDGPKVDVTASSGMLCVTVHHRPHWQAGLVALGSAVIFAAVLYRYWSLYTSSHSCHLDSYLNFYPLEFGLSVFWGGDYRN